MIDLTNYKIILYHYPYTTKELEKMIWDKMDTVDSRFAVKLTLDGVNAVVIDVDRDIAIVDVLSRLRALESTDFEFELL